MREIKFRAWDNKQNKMVHSSDFNMFYEFFEQACLDEDKAMQFTNQKDKNDKDIYEGDIVKCKRCRYETVEIPNTHPSNTVQHTVKVTELGEELGIVFFSTITGVFTIEYRRYDDYDDLSDCFGDRIEVVGNIHQNEHILPPWHNVNWDL